MTKQFDWITRWETANENNLPVPMMEVFSGLCRWVADIEGRLIDRRGRGRMPLPPKYSAAVLVNRATGVNAPAPIQRMLAEDLWLHATYMVKLMKHDGLEEKVAEMSQDRQIQGGINIMSALPSAVSLMIWLCKQIERELFEEKLAEHAAEGGGGDE